MKTLYLLRHGQAKWPEAGQDDFQRTLSPKGELDAQIMAQKVVQNATAPEIIICSNAPRAFDTAKLIALEINLAEENIQAEERLYLAGKLALFSTLIDIKPAIESLLLVGHNPGLTEFARYLAGRPFPSLPPCGLVCIEFNHQQWNNLIEGSGKLAFFAEPDMI